MKFTYDPQHNIAYLQFQERQSEVEAVRISDQLILDLAPDGSLYGIELLNANEQLEAQKNGELLLVNESTGARVRLPLTGV